MANPQTPAFDQHGPTVPQSPIVISVPHAGRDYPRTLGDYTAFRPDQLLPLEDPYVDLLAEPASAHGHRVIIARTPRAWIDLNRGENDLDPAMLQPPRKANGPLSAKARGGLGLIPRRTAGLGDLWHTGLSEAMLEERIALIHRPYHTAIRQAMNAAQRRFGIAILIDLHSMPPLPRTNHENPAKIVIGDRFGRSCHGRFSSRIAALAEQSQIKPAFNIPYAGGYILDQHGQPDADRHAIQIEFDRSLYLDRALQIPGPGLERLQIVFTALANALADEASIVSLPIAAE